LSACMMFAHASNAQSFPSTDDDWLALTRDGAPLADGSGDGNGWRDVVGDAEHPAAFVQRDAGYFYIRIRLDASPLMSNQLRPFGWGVEIDTDGDFDDYEFLLMVDGERGAVYLRQNTEQGTVGDPSDHAEVTLASYPSS